MATKTISFTLDASSINKAIKELKKYSDDFEQKVIRLRQLIGERIAWSASRGFSTALAADVVMGTPEPVQVEVTVCHPFRNLTCVIAEGDQAVFIEFGAGVYNNGAAGSSPHPWGPENGYLIGTYGKGKGKRKTWGYYKRDQEVVVTHGTPAAMPMFRGVQDAMRVFDSLVQEVFG